MKDKMKTFPIRVNESMIGNLRDIMRDYGFTSVSPFIRYILKLFYDVHKTKKQGERVNVN